MPEPVATVTVEDDQRRMPASWVLPFLQGLAGTLHAELELHVDRDPDSVLVQLDLPAGELWVIEYLGYPYDLPGAWVEPWCSGLAYRHGLTPEDLGVRLTNPGRQRRTQLLMICDQRGWLKSRGLKVV